MFFALAMQSSPPPPRPQTSAEAKGMLFVLYLLMFFYRHSFAGLASIKSWLKCWKPAESLLGTSEIMQKSQTTGMPFHRLCETVTIICLNPLQETIESLFHPEKNEAD